MKKLPEFSTSKGFLSAILIVWAILSLMPLYIMYTSSFTQVGVEFDVDDISLIPENANIDNYRNLISDNFAEISDMLGGYSYSNIDSFD